MQYEVYTRRRWIVSKCVCQKTSIMRDAMIWCISGIHRVVLIVKLVVHYRESRTAVIESMMCASENYYADCVVDWPGSGIHRVRGGIESVSPSCAVSCGIDHDREHDCDGWRDARREVAGVAGGRGRPSRPALYLGGSALTVCATDRPAQESGTAGMAGDSRDRSIVAAAEHALGRRSMGLQLSCGSSVRPGAPWTAPPTDAPAGTMT
jgi:hypothetical protein